MPGETYLKREGQAFVGPQTAWDTIKQPEASEAFLFNKISMQEIPERDTRTDVVGTRSRGATIEGRTTVTWSASMFAMGSGSATVPPDISPMIKAIFGVETIGSNVVYSFTKDLETVNKGLTISHFGNHFMFMAKNAVVKEISYNVSGGDQSTVDISGEATTLIRSGSSTVGATAGAGSPNIQVASGHGGRYSVGANIKVSGGAVAHLITAINGDIFTVAPTVTAAQVIGDPVIPFEPTGTTAGAPVSKIRGQFDIGGATYKILSGSVKISDPMTLRNDEFGNAVASGFDTGGEREISFETSIRLLKGNFDLYAFSALKTQKILNLIIGDTVGSRMKINMPAVEITPPSIESPDNEAAVFSISGFALPTANENEMTLTFD